MLAQLSTHAQRELTFEDYQYLGQQTSSGFVPVLHLETTGNWYTELRYNYEETGTFSVFSGFSFRGGRRWSYRFIPMAGFSSGRFHGWSAGLNTELSNGKLNVSASSQYSFSTAPEHASFFYNWSEAVAEVKKHVIMGLSVQYYRDAAKGTVSPGIVAGLKFGRMSIPLYLFRAFRNNSYGVLGFNYEFKKERNK